MVAWGFDQDHYADVYYLTGFYTHQPFIPDEPGRWRAHGHTALVLPIDGAHKIILLSVELPHGTVHLLHRHPNAEQIMYVLEGSCLALSEGEPVRLNEGDAVFIVQGEHHGRA